MDQLDCDAEIKSSFLDEAKELLSSIEECFLKLEKNPNDLENLNQIFRFAHNLKGSSGAVGFSELAEFTHELESLLLALKEGRRPLTPSIVDLLLRTNDYLVQTVETLRENHDADYANPALKSELINAQNNSPEETALEAEDSSNSGPVEVGFQPPIFSSAPENPSGPQKDENIRVSLRRIEKILNNVGELSILQSVMVQQGIELGGDMPRLMRETLSSMTKIIRETQELSMSLRMIPVKQTFQKMARIVRDTSRALNKEVELHLSGEDAEIDKTVLERLADPLVHIIRNAVDHGLENREERRRAGKPETGNIYLSAYHRAGQVVIEVRDDGRGLDAEKLIAKAIAKGILSPDTSISPEQAYQLIFAPGFSTKEEVTDISGRGVGMDVVKTNIAALQGNIEIETTLGKGTCFRIFLPLTLAIIDSVIVLLGTDRYVIPLSQVSEFFRPNEANINHVYDKYELLTLRDEPLPAFRLSRLLNGARKNEAEEPASHLTALIVRDGSNRAAAVLVDRIVAQQQVVIKPFSMELKGKPGIMGAAILGDGKPALILDLFDLLKSKGGFEKMNSKLKPTSGMEAA